MKFKHFYLTVLCAMMLTIFLTSCDKEEIKPDTSIVEEDLNGFDIQMPMDGATIHHYSSTVTSDRSFTRDVDGMTHKYFERQPTDEEVLAQYIPGLEIRQKADGTFEVASEGYDFSSAANPKFQVFDVGPNMQIYVRKEQSSPSWCYMGHYTNTVSFVMDDNPIDCAGVLYLCSDEYVDWRIMYQQSGCHLTKFRWFDINGSLKDTDYMKRTGYQWMYVRCTSESFQGSRSNENHILAGQCGSSNSGAICF